MGTVDKVSLMATLPLAILTYLGITPVWADGLPDEALILDDDRLVFLRVGLDEVKVGQIVGQLMADALEDQALAQAMDLLSAA